MSGRYEDRDGFVFMLLKNKKDRNTALAFIESQFDAQADMDVDEAIVKIKTEKLLRKGCVVKLLLYPLEWTLTRVIMGKEAAQILTRGVKGYYYFYKGEIDLEQFKKSLI